MIDQNDNLLWFKLNGFLRYALAHSSTRFFPLFVVNEYPKSGGSWVGALLGDALNVPFPRNRLPVFESSILHGHYMNAWNMHNVLIVWRDGRDVVISQYFHSFFKNERGNSRLVDKCRSELAFSDYYDVSRNLPQFMEYLFERRLYLDFSWSDFVSYWTDRNGCVYVRYEDLCENPVSELQRLVEQLSGRILESDRAEQIVDRHSFAKMSGRRVGEESIDSFMRKGVVGDWRNYFDERTLKQFEAYAGHALRKLGYAT